MIVVILLLAAFLRFFQLGAIPDGLYIDEAAILVDARSIVETGKDIHGNSMWNAIYPSYGDYKLPGYILATALSVKLFGDGDVVVRLPSAVAGVASVALVYVLAQQIFPLHPKRKEIGLWASAALAIMPWSLLFSRTGFEAHLAQMLVLLSIVLALQSKHARWMVLLSALVGAGAVYTYYSVRFVFPVVYAASCLFLILSHSKQSLKHKVYSLTPFFIAGIMIWAALLVPMAKHPLYPASQQLRLSADSILQNQAQYVELANEQRERMGNSLISRLVFHRYWYLLRDVAANYGEHLNPSYMFVTGDQNLRHGTRTVGLLLPTMFPIFVVGVFVLMKKYRFVLGLLLVWYLVALLPASVPLTVPHALRSINAMAGLALVVGLGWVELSIWLQAHKLKTLQVGLFGLVIINFILVAHDYGMHYPKRSAKAWSTEMHQLVGRARALEATGKNVVMVGDTRQSIYVIAYGKYDSLQEIQATPSVNFLKPNIGKISFSEKPPINAEPNTAVIVYDGVIANNGMEE